MLRENPHRMIPYCCSIVAVLRMMWNLQKCQSRLTTNLHSGIDDFIRVLCHAPDQRAAQGTDHFGEVPANGPVIIKPYKCVKQVIAARAQVCRSHEEKVRAGGMALEQLVYGPNSFAHGATRPLATNAA